MPANGQADVNRSRTGKKKVRSIDHSCYIIFYKIERNVKVHFGHRKLYIEQPSIVHWPRGSPSSLQSFVSAKVDSSSRYCSIRRCAASFRVRFAWLAMHNKSIYVIRVLSGWQPGFNNNKNVKICEIIVVCPPGLTTFCRSMRFCAGRKFHFFES